jgi:hypothetical protein
MNWVNDLIGLLILVMFLLIPLLRRGMQPQQGALNDENDEQELPTWKLPDMPIKTPIPTQHMPEVKPIVKKSKIPFKKKPQKDPLERLEHLNERQKIVLYKEIFGEPKAFD